MLQVCQGIASKCPIATRKQQRIGAEHTAKHSRIWIFLGASYYHLRGLDVWLPECFVSFVSLHFYSCGWKCCQGIAKQRVRFLLSSPVRHLEIRSAEILKGEAGSLCPKTESDLLLNDSSFTPPVEIFPRLMCVQVQRRSNSQVSPPHSNPSAVLPPVQSRI